MIGIWDLQILSSCSNTFCFVMTNSHFTNKLQFCGQTSIFNIIFTIFPVNSLPIMALQLKDVKSQKNWNFRLLKLHLQIIFHLRNMVENSDRLIFQVISNIQINRSIKHKKILAWSPGKDWLQAAIYKSTQSSKERFYTLLNKGKKLVVKLLSTLVTRAPKYTWRPWRNEQLYCDVKAKATNKSN